MKHPRVRFCCAGWLLLAALAGCGPGNPLGRKAISGKVTLDGKPLEQGNIAFQPLAAKGTSTGGVIASGSYSIKTDKGLPPGKYRVRINAAAAASPVDPNQPPGPAAAPAASPLIPPKYNTQSQLECEVTEARPNQFDFDLYSK